MENLVLIKLQACLTKNSPLKNSSWDFPPAELNLASNEVHLWRTELDLPAQQVEELATNLSTDEKLRADRFHFEIHRQRFIVGRATLRTILARYLNIEAKQLQFDYSPRGKPSLAGGGLEFNLSHSQGLAIYAFARDRKIGIDLEYLRSIPDADKIAQRFFSSREYQEIASLEKNQQQKAFFLAWTAKEAYLKATGDGLAGSLDGVEVTLTPGESVKIVSIKGNKQAASDWYLYSFAPASEYIASLVVKV